jgi:hypothetical protein
MNTYFDSKIARDRPKDKWQFEIDTYICNLQTTTAEILAISILVCLAEIPYMLV